VDIIFGDYVDMGLFQLNLPALGLTYDAKLKFTDSTNETIVDE
jgi:hypothetical protein